MIVHFQIITSLEDKEGLAGSFEVGGKKIKFSKNKDSGTAEDPKHLESSKTQEGGIGES